MKCFWKVSATVPKVLPSGVAYNATEAFGVVAETIDDALAAVRRDFPKCVIYSVSHHGKIQIEADAGRAGGASGADR